MPSLVSIILVALIAVLIVTVLLNEIYDEINRVKMINETRQDNQDYNEVLDSFENRYHSNAGDPNFIGGVTTVP